MRVKVGESKRRLGEDTEGLVQFPTIMISPVSSVPSLLAPCFLRGVLCGYILRIPFEPIEVDPPEPVKYNAFSLEKLPLFEMVVVRRSQADLSLGIDNAMPGKPVGRSGHCLSHPSGPRGPIMPGPDSAGTRHQGSYLPVGSHHPVGDCFNNFPDEIIESDAKRR